MQATGLWAGTALILGSNKGAYSCKLIRDDAEVRADPARGSPPGLEGALFRRRSDSQSGHNTPVFPSIPPRTPSDPEAEFARWGPRGGSDLL